MNSKDGAMSMIIETNRLILRHWEEWDAESLYEYARNPIVGEMTGWAVHTSVEYSLHIIREFLSKDETYAVTLKGENEAIGSIGLMKNTESNLSIGEDEAEIGYWIGEPYWGRGLIPEAVSAIMRYAFEELGISKIWCGYFDGNEKSKRVGEKCGFRFQRTEYEKEYPQINATKTIHVTSISRQEWNDYLNQKSTF